MRAGSGTGDAPVCVYSSFGPLIDSMTPRLLGRTPASMVHEVPNGADIGGLRLDTLRNPEYPNVKATRRRRSTGSTSVGGMLY